jgi:hypothetical protein
MKGIRKVFLFYGAALLQQGCFDFGSNPIFPPESDTTQEDVQDGEDFLEPPQDEPEGTADEEGIQPDAPDEPDSFDGRPEDVAPPDFPPDFPPDDLPVDEIPVGACIDEADQAIIMSVDIQGQCVSCVLGCMTDVDCLAGCVHDHTGLSEACSACYAEATICIYSNCLSPCLSDPESAACVECREASGCDGAFQACSGMADF